MITFLNQANFFWYFPLELMVYRICVISHTLNVLTLPPPFILYPDFARADFSIN